MSVVEIVIGAIILISCILIVLLCLNQDKDVDQGLTSALSGGSNEDSYYNSNKGSTRDAALKKVTRILLFVLIVATIVISIVPNLMK